MSKKLLTILVLLILPINVYGEENSEKQAKIIKNLTSRLEALENTVYDLRQEIASLKNSATTNVAGISNVNAQTSDKVANLDQEKTEEPKAGNTKESLVSEEKEKYDVALGLLKEGKLNDAEEKFAEFIAQFPNSSFQSNAHFWYAESFYQRSNFNQAAISYLKGYKSYPKGAKAADSLLKLAFSLSALNKNQEACSMLGKLESEFPNRPLSSIKRSNEAKSKFHCNTNKKKN